MTFKEDSKSGEARTGSNLQYLKNLTLAALKTFNRAALDGKRAKVRAQLENILGEIQRLQAMQEDLHVHFKLIEIYDNLLSERMCGKLDHQARKHILNRKQHEQSKINSLQMQLNRLPEIEKQVQQLGGIVARVDANEALNKTKLDSLPDRRGGRQEHNCEKSFQTQSYYGA
ncbi:hypothetical protein [Desulfoferrobacter suflitae]|uniref:hypothetical protein n=1 Tax=Desulfoferrobacter suflitae TaxID=2865782 RepID=UPI0021648891|nr:hypothetical protein [Desulfoferrobacter suflitae]MCK8600468.1 hypothetical protein [Desulfoferrobacter suflitae]